MKSKKGGDQNLIADLNPKGVKFKLPLTIELLNRQVFDLSFEAIKFLDMT